MLHYKLGCGGETFFQNEIPLTQQQCNSLDAGYQNNDKKHIKNCSNGTHACANSKKALQEHLDSEEKKPLSGLGVKSPSNHQEKKPLSGLTLIHGSTITKEKPSIFQNQVSFKIFYVILKG